MASTNPFQHAEDDFPADESGPGWRRRRRRTAADEAAHGQERVPLRGAGSSTRVQRKASRRSRREARVEAARDGVVSGFPALAGLKPVLLFLSMPALLVLAITLTGGGWPKPILYAAALGLGLIVALSALRGVELVLACMLIYLPFSKIFVVPIAPGVNGTNMLVLLGLFAAVLQAVSTRQKLTSGWPPGTVLVAAFAVMTSLSAVTISLIPGGRSYLLYNEILSYKAWIDQFIFYFILLICIRDVETAKRCVIYVMMGSMLVVLYSVPEMLDKMGRSTIEKSRIVGPHLQSNNFGGFVAYTVLPLIAVFFVYIRDLRAWLLTPYFLLTAKVLITTFSRGAYLAMVAGGFVAGYFKGRRFLGFWLAVMLGMLVVFPSLIPDSIMARMDDLIHQDAETSIPEEEKLDKSSVTRLIMWSAAGEMIMESPIFGKGFKGFPYLRSEYIDTEVEESDPHNMYLYIGSQMGLPALALFILILAYGFVLGRQHARHEKDLFIKAIGIGGTAAIACYAVVCVFGSRAVSLNFTVYFWTLLVVMQVLKQKQTEAEQAAMPVRERRSAFDAAATDNPDALGGDTGVRGRSKARQRGPMKSGFSNRATRAERRAGQRGAAAWQAADDASGPAQGGEQSQDADQRRHHVSANHQERAGTESASVANPAGPHESAEPFNTNEERLHRKLQSHRRRGARR